MDLSDESEDTFNLYGEDAREAEPLLPAASMLDGLPSVGCATFRFSTVDGMPMAIYRRSMSLNARILTRGQQR